MANVKVRALTETELDTIAGLDARALVIRQKLQEEMKVIQDKLNTTVAQITAEVEGGQVENLDGEWCLTKPNGKKKKRKGR